MPNHQSFLLQFETPLKYAVVYKSKKGAQKIQKKKSRRQK